jgi:hypothetical protein
MRAYKLMRLRKNGTLGSLFIDKKKVLKIGEWMMAEDCPTKGYAHRMGWHCLFVPIAPHLTDKGRIWVEVEVKNFHVFERPINQGGKWILANDMKIISILGRGKI